MNENIAKSDYIFIIATPRFKQRAEESKPNNLQFELNHILETKKPVVPILWDGDFKSSFPSKFGFAGNLCFDFTTKEYFPLLIGTVNPKGIVPTIFQIQNDSVYSGLVEDFCAKST